MITPRFSMSITMLGGLLAATASAAVNIETVPVGNPGNAGELSGAGAGGYGPNRICGAVAYTYEIGKYEVTAGQYAEFLNAVASSDPYGLYNSAMDGDPQGCQITRHGSSESYWYDFSGRPSGTAADWVNRPVNYVSWGDAARFVNWLHNGQGSGDTEDGVYDLSGTHAYYNPDGSYTNLWDLSTALTAVSRQAGWTWAIPDEDEWYKAAYHKNDPGGPGGDYFDYPTSNNGVPSNDLVDPDPGNNATYFNGSPFAGGDYTLEDPYWRTEVGAHENSESPYGTFDQGGNVEEWNESGSYSQYRGVRGGSFEVGGGSYLALHAAQRGADLAAQEHNDRGFRVAQVPEPATIMILALASVGVLRRKRYRD